jgi:2-hydroxychromene-2-carboxylate isomerase
MKTADWYFDFISPFAYLALPRVERLSKSADIRFRPILFAGLLDHWGQKGPAEIMPKRVWTYRWCTWLAAQQGVAFRFPAAHPFNPLPYLRLAIAAGATPATVRTIFDALWTTGADPGDENVLAGLASTLRIDPATLGAPAIKDRLRTETADAAALGVFGVPTLAIDGELFWGVDGMDFAEAYLADPSMLATDEMRRVSGLPVGVSRKL